MTFLHWFDKLYAAKYTPYRTLNLGKFFIYTVRLYKHVCTIMDSLITPGLVNEVV
jgi:hypothetical protein